MSSISPGDTVIIEGVENTRKDDVPGVSRAMVEATGSMGIAVSIDSNWGYARVIPPGYWFKFSDLRKVDNHEVKYPNDNSRFDPKELVD